MLLLLFVVWSTNTTNAQYFGGNAPLIKWHSINTPKVRLIFPAGMEQQATHVANVINYISSERIGTVGSKAYKLNLVFRNQTLVPNGYVGLAPYKSEFFVTPPQDLQMLGSLSWLDALSVHEYRHALQFSNHRRGINSFLYAIGGQSGWAIGEALLFPPWYYEGDAVVTETALTPAGRGRTPSFLAPLRSMASESIRIPYVTLRNGSYNQNLPNHYAYGYLMSSYGRDKFGNDFWMNVSRSATNLRGIFYPFGNSMKKHSKMRPKSFYNSAMLDFSSTWFLNTQKRHVVEGNEVALLQQNGYISYTKPTLLNDSCLLAIRESFSELTVLVKINQLDGSEESLFTMGQGADGSYSYNAGKVVWTVLHNDIRWQNQSTNSVYLYSMQTKKVTRLIKSARYLSPALSHDGKRLAVVNITTDLKFTIDILNAETGVLIHSLPNPNGFELFTPSWSNGDTSLIMVAKQKGKLAIVDQNVQDGLVRTLHGWTSNVIANPTMADGSVFFEASYGGIDNIFKLKLGSGEVERATSAQVGANQPSVANGMVAYSRYSLRGNRVMLIKDGTLNQPLGKVVEPIDDTLYGNNLAKLEGGPILDSIPSRSYDIKAYHPGLHLLNIHTWALVAQNGYTGFQIASTDVLNTLMVEGSVLWRRNESISYASVIYGGLYPYIGAAFQSNFTDNEYTVFDRWRENISAGIVQLPLNFSGRLFSRNVSITGRFQHHNVNFIDGFLYSNRNDNVFNSIQGEISITNLLYQARKDLNPRWGQAFSANYQRIVNGNVLYSGKESLTLRGSLFMAGIGQNHSLSFSGTFRNETMNSLYRFSDTTTISRGYALYDFDRLTRLIAQYSFPILYPDYGVNGLYFVKRLRANLFYDYSKLSISNYWAEFNSCGVELVADMTLFNLVQIPYGARYSYLLNKDPRNPNRKDFFEFFIRVTSF